MGTEKDEEGKSERQREHKKTLMQHERRKAVLFHSE
jgi:hypothetical protein